MPIIRLPEELREAVTDAFGNELSRRIGSGVANVDLTYRRSDATGGREYFLNLESGIAHRKRITCQGRSDGSDWTEAVPLRPEPGASPELVAQTIGIGNGEMTLYHTPPKREEAHKFRVVMTPTGSEAVYLAPEAEAHEGENVPMKRAPLYLSKKPRSC